MYYSAGLGVCNNIYIYIYGLILHCVANWKICVWKKILLSFFLLLILLLLHFLSKIGIETLISLGVFFSYDD